MNTNETFSKLCKTVGLDLDLVQAGGGNVSIKDGDDMYIKASGCMLFDVEPNKNFCIVDWKQIKEDFKNSSASMSHVTKYKTDKSEYMPSIETFFHAILNKYVVHVHPKSCLAAMNSLYFKDSISLEGFEYNKDFIILPYKRPGYPISQEIYDSMDKNSNIAPIIFLENHGVIVHGDDLREVLENLKRVVNSCNIDVRYDSPYKYSLEISSKLEPYFNYMPFVLPLKEEVITLNCSCPDLVVYLNDEICSIETSTLSDFINKNGLPSIVYYKNKYFAIGKNYLKCKQIEDMVSLNNYLNNFDTNSLSQKEISALKNWDAEKYRKGC